MAHLARLGPDGLHHGQELIAHEHRRPRPSGRGCTPPPRPPAGDSWAGNEAGRAGARAGQVVLEGVGRVDDGVLAGRRPSARQGVAQAVAALDELGPATTRARPRSARAWRDDARRGQRGCPSRPLCSTPARGIPYGNAPGGTPRLDARGWCRRVERSAPVPRRGGEPARTVTVRGAQRDSGSVKVNVEPAPSWLFTQIRPPWSSTNFRERASPSPVPSAFLSAVPTWRNSSNTAS